MTCTDEECFHMYGDGESLYLRSRYANTKFRISPGKLSHKMP